MSAMKTHDVYNVIHGDDVLLTRDDNEQRFKVKSLLVDRQKQHVCQIFTQTENTGSMASSESKARNCRVVSTEPDQHSVKFNVKALVGDQSQDLVLTSVKSTGSECVIC